MLAGLAAVVVAAADAVEGAPFSFAGYSLSWDDDPDFADAFEQ